MKCNRKLHQQKNIQNDHACKFCKKDEKNYWYIMIIISDQNQITKIIFKFNANITKKKKKYQRRANLPQNQNLWEIVFLMFLSISAYVSRKPSGWKIFQWSNRNFFRSNRKVRKKKNKKWWIGEYQLKIIKKIKEKFNEGITRRKFVQEVSRLMERNNLFYAVLTGSHPNDVAGPLAGTIVPENSIERENQWNDKEDNEEDSHILCDDKQTTLYRRMLTKNLRSIIK